MKSWGGVGDLQDALDEQAEGGSRGLAKGRVDAAEASWILILHEHVVLRLQTGPLRGKRQRGRL